MTALVFILEIFFENGPYYFRQDFETGMSLTNRKSRATSFPSKLAGEEFLLNLKFERPNNAVIEKLTVIEYQPV